MGAGMSWARLPLVRLTNQMTRQRPPFPSPRQRASAAARAAVIRAAYPLALAGAHDDAVEAYLDAWLGDVELDASEAPTDALSVDRRSVARRARMCWRPCWCI